MADRPPSSHAWAIRAIGRTASRCAALVAASILLCDNGHAQTPSLALREAGDTAMRRAAVETYLRHIYSVYLGIRACHEMSATEADRSFRPDVSLDEARRTLRAIDAATAEVGLDADGIWAAVAPQATVTAEALKSAPQKYLPYCQKMGSLFRNDAGNLQANLGALGARTPLISKDY